MSKAAYLLTSLHAALVILPALAQIAARETAEALGYNTR